MLRIQSDFAKYLQFYSVVYNSKYYEQMIEFIQSECVMILNLELQHIWNEAATGAAPTLINIEMNGINERNSSYGYSYH